MLFREVTLFTAWDVFGYYIYILEVFVYGDLALTDVDHLVRLIEQYELSSTLYQIHPVPGTDHHIIQYSMGLAVLFTPFFLIGHCIAFIGGYELNQYI